MQVKEYLQIANSTGLWAACIPMISVVVFQAIAYVKRGYKAAPEVGLSYEDCNKALRVGMTSSIGPSLSVFVVMVAMMGVIGAPVTWMRLSMIGAANTELTCATFGAEAMNVEFGGINYDITAFVNSVWAMALNGCGWLIFCGLFTDKLGVLKDKVAGGDNHFMQVISGAAVLGTASYLVSANTKSSNGGIAPDKLIGAIVAAIFMVIFTFIGKKVKWMNEYALGFSMILGMICAVLAFNGGVK